MDDLLRRIDGLEPTDCANRRLLRNGEAKLGRPEFAFHCTIRRTGIAWYAHQANTYGDHRFRPELFEPEAYSSAPLFRRIGMVLDDLKKGWRRG